MHVVNILQQQQHLQYHHHHNQQEQLVPSLLLPLQIATVLLLLLNIAHKLRDEQTPQATGFIFWSLQVLRSFRQYCWHTVKDITHLITRPGMKVIEKRQLSMIYLKKSNGTKPIRHTQRIESVSRGTGFVHTERDLLFILSAHSDRTCFVNWTTACSLHVWHIWQGFGMVFVVLVR